MSKIFDVPTTHRLTDVPSFEKNSLVLYHGEYCPHCAQPRKEWIGVVDKLTNADPKNSFNVVKIESSGIPADHDISVVPTIILYKNGVKTHYPRDEPMTQENIVNFVKHNFIIKDAKFVKKTQFIKDSQIFKNAGKKSEKNSEFFLEKKSKNSRFPMKKSKLSLKRMKTMKTIKRMKRMKSKSLKSKKSLKS